MRQPDGQLIHRIGQIEVCHLWSLVAKETREGDVYHRLLEKLVLVTGQLRLGSPTSLGFKAKDWE